MSRMMDRMERKREDAKAFEDTNKNLEDLVEQLEISNESISSLLDDDDSYAEDEAFLFEDEESDNEEALFEGEDMDEDEESLFEDEDEDEDEVHTTLDSLFEDEDAMEGRDLGTIQTHDGQSVSFSVIEEGDDFSSQLAGTIKKFQSVKESKTNYLMEAVYEIGLMEADSPKKGSKSGLIVHRREQGEYFKKNAEGKSGYRRRNAPKGGVDATGENNNPELAIEKMANQSGVKQAFAYNKRLDRKLSKFNKTLIGKVPKEFQNNMKMNTSWIYKDMKEVVLGIAKGDLSKADSSLQKTLTETSSFLKKAKFRNPGDMFTLAGDLIKGIKGADKKLVDSAMKKLKTGGAAMLDEMQDKAKKLAKERAKDPRSSEELRKDTTASNQMNKALQAQEARSRMKNAPRSKDGKLSPKVVFEVLMEEVYEAANFSNPNKKDGTPRKNGSPKAEAFKKLGIKESDKDIKHLMSLIGATTTASLAYGSSTGAYGFSFFLGLMVAGGTDFSKSEIKEIEFVRHGRALAGKLAHDLKWIARFNRAGLLNSTVQMRQGDKAEELSFPGAGKINAWLKKNDGKIGTILGKTAAMKAWGGHYKFGRKQGGTSSQVAKNGLKQGKEAKTQSSLLEELELFTQLIF